MSIVHVNGVDLWTATTGPDGAPPMILCHGGPGAADYLGPLAARLPARVHRFEQRGCGRSAATDEDDIDALIADIDALRAHWGLDRFVMAGHSWGAALALLYALEHPERVAGLLYLCGLGIETGWQAEHNDAFLLRLSAESHARFDALVAELATAEEDEERDRVAGELLELALAVECADAETRAALLERPLNRQVNQALTAEWFQRIAGPSLAERVAELDVPALMLQGANDTRPNWPAENLAKRLPRARYVALQGAGHFPWFDRPDEFLGEIRVFLEAAASG